MSDSALQTTIQLQKAELTQKDVEIKKLKKALRTFVVQYPSEEEDDGAIDSSDDDMDRSEGQDEVTAWLARLEEHVEVEEMDNSEDENLPGPIQTDEFHGSYFCTRCGGEVVEGVCCFCSKEHQWPEDAVLQEPASTETQAIHPDRSLIPRGNTPLREINMTGRHPPKKYWELLRRGASQLMCETFQLQFSYSKGIYAWADSDLFEEFSGSAMRPGDRWKIHLGRRITLDEDDLEGSAFIEGLIEDAQLFSFQSVEWETREESPGIWVTRPSPQLARRYFDGDEVEISDRSETDEVSANLIKDKALEDITVTVGQTAIRPNEYSLSDDDSEQGDLEMDDPEDFTMSGPDAICNLNLDAEEDELADNAEPQAGEDGRQCNPECKEGDMNDSDSNSDEAGSDFDSDEMLSGDEIVLSQEVTIRNHTRWLKEK